MMDARRLAMLEAMGIDVLALRARTHASVPAQTPLADAASDWGNQTGAGASNATDAARSPRLCIVCAHGVRSDVRLKGFFAQIARALALDAAALGWLEADAASVLPAPPAASAYLVLGSALVPAFGAQLATAQQNAAVIAVSDDAADLPGDAAGKRALWQALKPIARRLAAEQA